MEADILMAPSWKGWGFLLRKSGMFFITELKTIFMKKYITICMLTALAALAGCSPGRFVVQERPAEPVYERPAPPNSNFIWIGPGYVKKGGKYEYRSGYWISPPNSNHHWIDGRWKQTRRGWVWVNGHWG
jgi:hypothetical protein